MSICAPALVAVAAVALEDFSVDRADSERAMTPSTACGYTSTGNYMRVRAHTTNIHIAVSKYAPLRCCYVCCVHRRRTNWINE